MTLPNISFSRFIKILFLGDVNSSSPDYFSQMKRNTLITRTLEVICMAMLVSCGNASPSAVDPIVAKNNTTIATKDGSAMLDHDTELSTAFAGLTVTQTYIVDGNDKKIAGSKVALNSNFSIVYEGVKNYTLKDGKAFPNLSMQVINDQQQTVISKSDLFATSYPDGLSESDASVLRATVIVGDPIKPGKYICTVQVIDKNNNNAVIHSTWSFEVE
jgi:hypothetical protein